MTTTTRTKEYQLRPYGIDAGERKKTWMKVWGIWRSKKPDPIKVMRKLRKELDRKIV